MLEYMLLKKNIRDHVGSSTYDRGSIYEKRGKVKGVKIEDDTITGMVRGSARSPYKVVAILLDDKIKTSKCSCPMGRSCKHVAALCISALRHYNNDNNEKTIEHQISINSFNILNGNNQEIIKKLEPSNNPQKPTWQETIEQTLAKEADTKSAELQFVFRIEDTPSRFRYLNTYYGNTRRETKIPDWQLQIRPRIKHPYTGRVSVGDISWRDAAYAGLTTSYNSLSRAHELLLCQCATALGYSHAISGAVTWIGLSLDRAQMFWNFVQNAKENGITFFTGRKGNIPVEISADPVEIRTEVVDNESGIVLQQRAVHYDKLCDNSMKIIGDPMGFALRLHEHEYEHEYENGQGHKHGDQHKIEKRHGQARNNIEFTSFSMYPVSALQKNTPNADITTSRDKPNTLGPRIRLLPHDVVIPASDIAKWQKDFAPKLIETYPLINQSTKVKLPEKALPRLYMNIQKAGEQKIRVTTSWMYNTKKLPLSHSHTTLNSDNTLLILDTEQEQYQKDILYGMLASYDSIWNIVEDEDADEIMSLKSPFIVRGMNAARFVKYTIPQMSENNNFILDIADDLPQFFEDTTPPEFSFRIDEKDDSTDWFDLNMSIMVSGEEVLFQDLFSSLSLGEEYLLLPSGRYFSLTHSAFNKLRELMKESEKISEWTPKGISVSRFQAGFWNELTELGVISKQAKTWQTSMQGLMQGRGIERFETPSELNTKLRPYQKLGAEWLHFLHTNRLGGILGDDMGLGKTIQALAIISSLKKKNDMNNQKENASNKIKKPVLIIAPTSVVENWDLEIKKFVPTLSSVIMRSGDRTELFKQISSSDIIVTSYALLVRDFTILKEYKFDALILDEAQAVKNYQSKAYSIVRQMQATSRFALTGTPFENNLMELWSLFSIVSPGLFGKPEHFRDLYQKPIEKGENVEALKRLKQRIKPFLLRRTKEVVAKELPQKTEQTLTISLSPPHQRLYDQYLQLERKRVLGLLSEGGLNSNRFQVLRSLTILRQLALHPALIDKKHGKIESAKIDALKEQLLTISQEGHRSLVFSQFTSFLSIVQQALEKEKVPYLYLDGSTRNRSEIISKFQSGKGPSIFLISLKAGGVGLNLTAADYCFILDPWWNPAVENQAIDRTHRIGQTRNVFVYRLISQNTIEEKVQALQQKKRKLFNALFQEGARFDTRITEQDIRALLS